MQGNENKFSPRAQKTAAAASLAVMILLTVLLLIFVGRPLIRFASNPEAFRAWVDARGFLGRLAYMGMVYLQVVVAVIPGEPFEIAAGYAFSTLEGSVLCIAAATAGSITVFLLVKRFGMRLAEVFFSREKLQSLHFLKSSEKRNFLFLLIFMMPGTPKDLLSYFAGLTDMSLPLWIMISSLGRLPSVLTSTLSGNALGSKNYLQAVIIFSVTLAISIAGLCIYNYICKIHAKRKSQKSDSGSLCQTNKNNRD